MSISEDSSPLFAGMSRTDITPVEDTFIVPKGGCALRLPDGTPGEKTVSKKVLDPVEARVLVLKNSETSLAIVTLDVVLFSSEKVIAEAKEKWGVKHVILSCTHTHSSMVPRGMCPSPEGWGAWEGLADDLAIALKWPTFSEDPWYAATEEKIIAAIGEAMGNLFPARIAGGKEHFTSNYMAHNRRLVKADGSVTMMWDNPDRLPTAPIDPSIGVIKVIDGSGEARALLVHYACHPVGLMDCPVISRDFPGAMCDYVESELGEQCMAMFLQGAMGDMDPYDMRFVDEAGFNLMRQAGISLGQGALKVAENLKPRPGKKTEAIEIREDHVTVPFRDHNKTLIFSMLSILINDSFAMINIAGEPFIQHQLDLTDLSPVPMTLLLGTAYSGSGTPHGGYIPTVQAAKEGGYGVTNSFVAAETGSILVRQAVATLKELIHSRREPAANQP